MPTTHARALCPHAVFVPGDMAKYRRVSAQIRQLFASVSSDVEPLSLDEAFIDITGSRPRILRVGAIAIEAVRRVLREAGLPDLDSVAAAPEG